MKTKKFKITVGALGLVVSSIVNGSDLPADKAKALMISDMIRGSGCINVTSCAAVTMADILKEMKINGKLDIDNLKSADNCGSCVGRCISN